MINLAYIHVLSSTFLCENNNTPVASNAWLVAMIFQEDLLD